MKREPEPRSHGLDAAAHLAELPLESGAMAGLRAVEVSRAETRGALRHGCRLTTYSPVLADGRRPARTSAVLPYPPRLEPLSAPDGPDARRARFEADGQCLRAQVAFSAGTDFYGLGLCAGRLRRNGRTLLLWNTDAWGYGEHSPALYQSHPWLIALERGGRATGILAESSRRGMVQVAADGVEWSFEGEPFDLHLIDGPDVGAVLSALCAMIGTVELPPRWALGYHQCRWSYADDGELRAVAKELRARQIPCDALWLDIDHMDRGRVLSWDARAFPDPARLTADLRAAGFQCVAILDPGIVADERDPLCADGLAHAHFVADAFGRPLRGRVWPGQCYFPDFTSDAVRAWWAARVRDFVLASGIEGLWTDMNEPALFRVPARTLPDDARHAGDARSGPGDHARFHNLYGQLMAEATRAGLLAARPERRPFVLTRASHLAGARLAATWTGDNQARWEDLAWTIPMLLSLGLSGQPFAGADIGGFQGDPDEELFVRWFELGAWLPFARGHAEKHSRRKEPWAFGPSAERLVRDALEARMRLLPTWLTLFEECSRTGLPPLRPLFLADPLDARLRGVDDAFLWGGDLLVAPVVQPGARSKLIPLPSKPGGWFAYPRGGRRRDGPEHRARAPLGSTPVLARAGSIVVEGPTRQHVGELDDLRVFHVFLDHEGRARGRTYEDGDLRLRDGAAPCRREELEARVEAGRLEWRVDARGDWVPPRRRWELRVHGWPGTRKPGVRVYEVPQGEGRVL